MAGSQDTMTHAEQMSIYEALSRKKLCVADKVRNYLNPINFCYPKFKNLGMESKKALELTKKYQVIFDALDSGVLTPLHKAERFVRDTLSEEYAF